ncbi:hypothetical protein BGX38DRAFT_1139743 [Terfezia claveryi]|nr:hypothetical protein BGX38DRAFT_1139743 [Terfezia claveryi]
MPEHMSGYGVRCEELYVEDIPLPGAAQVPEYSVPERATGPQPYIYNPTKMSHSPFDILNDPPASFHGATTTASPYAQPPQPPLESPSISDIPPLNVLLPNPSHRADLALLVSTICEVMRGNFRKTWDCMPNCVIPPAPVPAQAQKQASLSLSEKRGSTSIPNSAEETLVPSKTGEFVASPSPTEEEDDLIVWDKGDSIAERPRDSPPPPAPGGVKQRDTRQLNTFQASGSVASTKQKLRTSKTAATEYRKRSQKRLRASAFEDFDKWAERLQRRVFEVVNSRDSSTSSRGANRSPLPTTAPALAVPEDGESLYPPIDPPTLLLNLPFETREKILHSLLLLLISLEHYDARSRVLLHFLSSSLSLPPSSLLALESTTAATLINAAHVSATAESQKAIEANKIAKRWKVGLASVAGAAVIGLTGGLAAPFVAAGIGGLLSGIGLGATVAAGYLGAVAGSGAIVGALFGAYGGKMTGEMVGRYASEVEDFAFIPLQSESTINSQKQRPNPHRAPATTFDQIATNNNAEPDKKLLVTIGISGWLTKPEDITLPWRCLSPRSSSLYALRFDPSALIDIGTSLDTLLESYTWRYVQYEIVKRTVLATLYLALWPLVLVKAARVIDNPYSVARHRAEKAGRVLADVLCNRVQGERPVNLIGFGLGARVVYYAMRGLAQRGAWGVVQDVYFLGAPVQSGNRSEWVMIRAAASGRVVNGYSGSDWVLGFLERGSTLNMGIAGLQGVEGVWGIENVQLGEDKAMKKEAIVEGHSRYGEVMGVVLRECGLGRLGGLEDEEVVKEGVILEKLREKTRKDMEAVEREEIENEERNTAKKAKQDIDREDTYRAMRKAMQRETEQRTAEDRKRTEDSLRDLVVDDEKSLRIVDCHPLMDWDERIPAQPEGSESTRGPKKIGDWTETEEGIDEVVERIERELMERRRRRVQK